MAIKGGVALEYLHVKMGYSDIEMTSPYAQLVDSDAWRVASFLPDYWDRYGFEATGPVALKVHLQDRHSQSRQP